MPGVPGGGPATINGVLYQMLWALARAGRLSTLNHQLSDEELVDVTLVLEPSDGGDQQEVVGDLRLIQQLKARSSGGTWSLAEVIQSVFPDLYRAVDLDHQHDRYEFVTEGRRGSWEHVESFFAGLKERQCKDGTYDLDSTTVLPFKRQSGCSTNSFWGAAEYTEQSLFETIVGFLRTKNHIRDEPLDLTKRKLFRLLSGFRFVGNVAKHGLEVAIDKLLLANLGNADKVAVVRNQLLFDLATKAIEGDATIVANEFFESHGLTGIPLTDWISLSDKSAQHLDRTLKCRNVDLSQDVRPSLAKHITETWPQSVPITVIHGESGLGKSWIGYGILVHAAASQQVALLVDCRGDADLDLVTASREFWHDCAGKDEAPPFQRIRDRLAALAPSGVHADRQFCVFFDGLSNHDEAKRLAQKPWRDWGVRVVFACDSQLLPTIRTSARADWVQDFEIGPFTDSELQLYLEGFVGDRWTSIPGDIRDVLRRPLMANLYRSLTTVEDWLPENEYVLIERFWSRLLIGEQLNHPGDARALSNLACELTSNVAYPWSLHKVATSSSDTGFHSRLARLGWLRFPDVEHAEIPHARLTGWAIAKGLVSKLEEEQPRKQVVDAVVRIYRNINEFTAPVGYACMDFVWLAAINHREVVCEILKILCQDHRSQDCLLEHLIPTLGIRGATVLIDLLAQAGRDGDGYRTHQLVKSIASIEANGVSDLANQLLDDICPQVNRCGLEVLAKHPSPLRLDRIWELHKSRHVGTLSLNFGREDDIFVYNATFDALRECASLDLLWLENAVHQAESTDPVGDLAYIVAHVEDEKLWIRVRKSLFEKIAPNRTASLARNIGRYRDHDYALWLVGQLGGEADFVGAISLSALINIDPELARQNLGKLAPFTLVSTANWNFHRLLALDKEATQAEFIALLREQASPWDLADAFRDTPNLMGEETLSFLLDELEGLIERDLVSPEPSRHSWSGMELISKVTDARLLALIKGRRGSSLENKLTERFLQLAPRQSVYDDPDRRSCIRLLELIGGEGFTTAVNELLNAESFYGRIDGLRMSSHRRDRETISLLAERMRSDKTHEGHAIEQGYAAAALADLCEWSLVVEYIGKYGLRGLDRVYDYHREFECLPDECLSQLGLSETNRLTEGQIEAIGFSGRTDHADKVIATFKDESPDSNLAHACVLAVRRLELDDESLVPLLKSQLDVQKHRRNAAAALYRMNTDSAMDLLVKSLHSEYQHEIAVDLLRDDRTKERVIECVIHYLSGLHDFDVSPVSTLVQWVEDTSTLRTIFAAPKILEGLKKLVLEPEGNFWHTGSKATRIRALATVDPEFAYSAAVEAFRQKRYHDRNYYPSILVELDPNRSKSFLIQHLLIDHEATLVRWAVGEALSEVDADSTVLALAESEDINERFVACCLAERYTCDGLIEHLRELVRDPASKVANAALPAYLEQNRLLVASELASEFIGEQDTTQKWNLLRAFVDTAPPGSHGSRRANWLQKIGKDVPHGMWKFAIERQEIQRKQEKQTADRRDKV